MTRITSLVTVLALTTLGVARAENPAESTARAVEGELGSFLGEPLFEKVKVHEGGRFPNVVVAMDGTVVAVWNGVVVKRSEDGGATWGPTIKVHDGFMGGGVTVDENTGEILAFVEERHPPAVLTVAHSTDHGKTWKPLEVSIAPDSNGHVPSMHMNEHGITLRHGKHAGRLIRATRHYAGKNDRSKWPEHYTNAMYSDDGGRSWRTSAPFPANGTGEATIAELADGRLYYNSRRHWAPEGENPLRRWTAWSDDGGATWKQLAIEEALPDGPQNTNYGCMGGLTRLPVKGRDVLLYCNCDSPTGRDHGTVWASFDGGRTWPLKRLIEEGRFAYSSMASGRPGTRTAGRVFLHYESAGGSTVARFNLAWVLAGEKTGDGEVPAFISSGAAE